MCSDMELFINLIYKFVLAAFCYWRRIGMIKPPVQLGVDKKYFSEEKEPPVLE